MLVKASLQSRPLRVDHNLTESVWCENDRVKFVVGALYRPPASDPNVLNQLRKIAQTFSSKCILVVRDFHLPDVT